VAEVLGSISEFVGPSSEVSTALLDEHLNNIEDFSQQ